jgi:hypothetical protein
LKAKLEISCVSFIQVANYYGKWKAQLQQMPITAHRQLYQIFHQTCLPQSNGGQEQ